MYEIKIKCLNSDFIRILMAMKEKTNSILGYFEIQTITTNKLSEFKNLKIKGHEYLWNKKRRKVKKEIFKK